MKNVEFLLGTDNLSKHPMIPFNDEVCEFVARLSTILFHNKSIKLYPDVLSFAYWCRKSNIKKLQNNYECGEIRIGRGIVFHVAPSNVPVNFAFSCVFSLLAGNSNIVRVPSKLFPQISVIIDAFKEAVAIFPHMSTRVTFIRYPKDDETTANLSYSANCRVVWGGNNTVATVKNMPSQPRCIDMFFPDRYSFAILDGKAIRNADQDIMSDLAKRFYNDTFLMDQNACSSPQMIFWQNAENEDKEKFWNAVTSYATKNYLLQGASVIDKLTKSCVDAVNIPYVESVHTYNNLVYRICLNEKVLTSDISGLRGRCGYFYESNLLSWKNLIELVTEKYQTLTYYGINPEQVCQIILENGVRGIDRVVPIGSAMDIGIVWDGFDIIRILSRRIEVQ